MKKVIFLLILFLVFSVGVFLATEQIFAENLSSKFKGKILLQVESKGEAWYVSPVDQKRYSMGKPKDAFDLMRKLGSGISNDNLKKIQIADENFVGLDSDDDGLPDMVEDSVGTDKNNKDSDGDGYDDKKEIITGYNPIGKGKILINNIFAKKQAGKIFLQVESKGEAWYVNPQDSKRIFLGRPADALNLMRKLGAGISNNDLSKIQPEGPVLNLQLNNKIVKNVSSSTTIVKLIEVKKPIGISNPDVCNNISDQTKKNECFWGVAETNKDLSICDKIQASEFKNMCYGKIAGLKQDSSICDTMQNVEYKNACYNNVAEAKQDLSICDKIQSQEQIDLCYNNIAEAKQDLSICDKIQSQHTKDVCYWDIAKIKQDSIICNKIQDQIIKDECFGKSVK